MQLGQVLNLCLASLALARVTAFWACGFLYNTTSLCCTPAPQALCTGSPLSGTSIPSLLFLFGSFIHSFIHDLIYSTNTY